MQEQGTLQSKDQPNAEPAAVLCVDADDFSNSVVGNILGSDAELWTAHDMQAAIAAISRRKFDLVICDITSERTRGLDVLSILGTLHPSTPVLVTSETGISEWASEAFSALGAYAGMTKPYNTGLLRSVINEALWPTPVMGKGEVGGAVLLTASIHETAQDELERLSEEERQEISTVAEVLDRLQPFFSNQTRQGGG